MASCYITDYIDDIIARYCIVLYSTYKAELATTVQSSFSGWPQNINGDIQQQSNAIKRLCLVYATTVRCTRGRTTRYYVLVF